MLSLTAKAVPRRSLTAVALAAAAPAAWVALRGGRAYDAALYAGTFVAAACLAYAVEDDAAATLAASPTSLLRRRALRAGVAAPYGLAGWAAAVAIAGHVDVATKLLLVTALCSAGSAVAMAAVAQREGWPQVGLVGVVTGALAPFAMSLAAVQVDWLPTVLNSRTWARWLPVVGAAWAAALWLSRDPARS